MPESRNRKKKTAPTPHAQAQSTPTPSPKWWAPTMSTFMIVGLIWVVSTYLFRGQFPIPGIGNWNLGIGFGLIMAGFLMTMRWR